MNIDKLIKEATLERNSSKKDAYRAIKSEILLAQTSKNKREVNEIQIIRKLIKQREDSASIYDANSRKDLADIERNQIKYLKELLPPEISEDSIKELILLEYPTGYTQKDMGKVMKLIKQTFPSVDGKRASEIVKSYITN